jgi:hypothetical protein
VEMHTADWALVISLFSAVIALSSLAWNVWPKFIYPKPTVRIRLSYNDLAPRCVPDRLKVDEHPIEAEFHCHKSIDQNQ